MIDLENAHDFIPNNIQIPSLPELRMRWGPWLADDPSLVLILNTLHIPWVFSNERMTCPNDLVSFGSLFRSSFFCW